MNNTPLCKHTMFSLHFSIEGHLGCFQFMAIINIAALNMDGWANIFFRTQSKEWHIVINSLENWVEASERKVEGVLSQAHVVPWIVLGQNASCVKHSL